MSRDGRRVSIRNNTDVAGVINACLAKRPPVLSESSLDNGGKLLRYAAVPTEPRAPRNEAFFTNVPGMLLAALTVHPSVEQGAGGELTADRIAARLGEPPIGLLTGIWQTADGQAYLERGGVVHTADREDRWTPLTLPDAGSHTVVRMIGRQADGAVYLHNGEHLWRASGTTVVPVETDPLPKGAAVRVSADGKAQLLHDGAIIADGAVRPIELWRSMVDSQGIEQSPARPVDLLPLPHTNTALILDDKGRVYQANLKGDGAVEALRLTLFSGQEQGDGWAVTSMGLSKDNTVHLMLEDRTGRRMSLQRAEGEARFQSAYLLDRPLLLIHTEGLHTPSETAVQSRIQIDGHAQLGHIDGVLHYQADPTQPWERLKLPGGEPLTGVTSLHANPSGFIDRRPTFAYLGDSQQLVELKLEGRTSWLPADDVAPRHPSGGPLAIVPDTVELRIQPLTRFNEPVQALAVHNNRQSVALTESGRLIAAGGGEEPHKLPHLTRPMAIAIGLDDQLHVLHKPRNELPQLQRLSREGVWEPVPIVLPGSTQPTDLRTTRTGQIQLRLGSHWHTLLPSMTASDSRRLPARVAPTPADGEPASADIPSGTNARVNRQQPSRISTPHHDALVSTTLLGTTANDPLTPTSNIRAVADTTRAQAGALARDVLGKVAVGTFRTVTQKLGIPLPPTAQERRLACFHDEARQAYDAAKVLFSNLPTLAEVRIASTMGPGDHERFGLSPEQGDRLLTLREEKLEALLRDLRKIGFHEGLIMGDLGFGENNDDPISTSSTPTFRLAEQWRRQRSKLDNTLSHVGLSKTEDVLPDLSKSLRALAGAAAYHPERLGEREAELLTVLSEVSEKMKRAGVRLPADDGHVDNANAGVRYGLKTAGLVAGLVEYDALLRSASSEALDQAERRQQDSRLSALCKLGMTSWHQLEAFDGVVTAFREQITLPGSARRTQLLKNLGLEHDAKPDEMASRMSELLFDLFNRSTFFSTQTRGLELRGSLGSSAWTQLNAFSVGVTGEDHHVLGVERIGDGKEGDAGLVAFFVRHAKASSSTTAGVGIDFKPGSGTGLHTYDTRPGRSMTASWGGSGSLTMSGTYQHGRGAAAIIAPSSIPDFVRLLFDVHSPDPTQVLRTGVNGGSIGLDLFETNLSASAAVNVSASPFSLSQLYGSQKPSADPANLAAAGASNRRSTTSGSLGASGAAQAGAHWGQMELHLDHAWREIIGLEFQGRTDFNLEVNSALNLGGTLSSALGNKPAQLINTSTNSGNLQLAGIRVASSDVQLPTDAVVDDTRRGPFLSTASYKRTFDTEAAKPITAQEWDQMHQRLSSVFPKNIEEFGSLDYPATPGDRINTIERLLDRIQSPVARAIESGGAMEGAALRFQRGLAAREMRSAGNNVWSAASEIDRSSAVEMLHQLRQQDQSALQHRARVIPGARVEFNLFGRESLETVVFHAIGHLGLGSKLNDLGDLRRKVPGLDQVMRSFQSIPNVNQVRYVFEMRPQARFAINDALMAREHQTAARSLGLPEPQNSLDWRTVLDKIRTTPDLYRLAAIAVHNTDENPVTTRLGLPLLTVTSTGAASHQLFEAEIQFRYGLYDDLQGVEVLEAGSRALQMPLRTLQQSGIQALGQRTSAGEVPYGPASPRKGTATQARLVEPEPHEPQQRIGDKIQRMQSLRNREADAISSFQKVHERASAHIERLLDNIPALPGSNTEINASGSWTMQKAVESLKNNRQILNNAVEAMRQNGGSSHVVAEKQEGQQSNPKWKHLDVIEQSRRSLGQAIEILAGKGAEACMESENELNEVSGHIDELAAKRKALLAYSESGSLSHEEVAQQLQNIDAMQQHMRASLLGEQQAMQAFAAQLDKAIGAAAEGDQRFSEAVHTAVTAERGKEKVAL
ncbi:type III effector [Brenneria alni]|uniref:Type III effector n=1 Tax=Brenneria alni TaxID=71656 RepID=A0A421DJ81_9GAMM|nr:type III effector [Brenneria alni]